MGIDKLLVLAGYDFLYLFNIFNRNQVSRIGYGGMTVTFLVENG